MNQRIEIWTPREGWEKRRGHTDRNQMPSAAAFAGDPGNGNYYVGVALGPAGRESITAWRSAAGYPGDAKVSLIHDYVGSSSTQLINQSNMNAIINEGFIVSLSFKATNWSHAAIVAGSADTAITNTINYVKSQAPWPFWFCFHHEPEDIEGATAQADFRAATRYIIQKFRDANVTNVAWQPIMQNPFTFEPATPQRDWRVWHADWNGTGWHTDFMMDLFGGDTYCPLPNGTRMRTIEEMFTTMFTGVRYDGANSPVPGVKEAGIPAQITENGFTMPEFGMSFQTSPDPNWSTWAQDAVDFAQTNNIKLFCYWDSSIESANGELGRWSFGQPPPGSINENNPDCYDRDGLKMAGWQIIIDNSVKWVAP